ncbi:DNA-binding transcriptional regulator, CsgD family [Rhizobium sp. RU33A]|uniref:helix-turn-helix transcriptional regulator n=1 Tax=Rhizobium sp. RU33A TaxID=1907413 RepID=UPI000954E2B3|nr:LuxR family transcriptional regulator [Rhizobium sp. RU33A]SIR00886.1 DNA-binding transcriptional regulator, CsgD family [Rhizobium sp. RU33A]
MAISSAHIDSLMLRGSGNLRSTAILDLSERINDVARRWRASALGIYEHQSNHVSDSNDLIYGWEDENHPCSLVLDPGASFALDVQWKRLLLHEDASFDGPSIVRVANTVALRYVAQPFAMSATYIIVFLPLETSDAAKCSLELDAAINVAPLSGHAEQALLTKRELEIAQWVSQGKTSPEVAIILSLSEYTINDHIRSGMKKMGATNRLSFIANTIRRGLVV